MAKSKCEVMLTTKYGLDDAQAKHLTKEMSELIRSEKWDKSSKSFVARTQQEMDLIERGKLEYARRITKHIRNFDKILDTKGVQGAIDYFDNMIAGSRTAGEFKGSVATLNKSIKARYWGFFNSKLKEHGVTEKHAAERMVDPEGMKDILITMEKLNKRKDLKDVDPGTVSLARAINDTAVYGRNNAIDGGVELNIRADHLITQKLTHNQAKLIKAGKKAWVENTAKRLDLKKTFPTLKSGKEIGQALEGIYKEISQAKLQRGTGTVVRARKLHFKDAAAFADQHKEFGEGELLDMFTAQMNSLSKAEALQSVIGPRAEQMLDSMESTLETKILDKFGTEARDKFLDTNIIGAKGRRDSLRRTVIGHRDTPASSTFGEVLDAFRSMNLLKLGGAVLNTPTDLATSVASLMSTTGMGAFKAQSRIMSQWASQLSPSHRKQMAQLMGIDSQMTLNRMTGEETSASGFLGKFTNNMMKLTLLDQTTKINQGTLATVKGNFLAEEAGKAFDNLNPRLQAQFKSFGITSKDWDVIRTGVDSQVDGLPLITPQKVAELGGRELENKYSALIMHDSGFGAIVPDARARAALNFGINPESVQGKFLQTLFMFKSFSIRAAGAIEEIIKSNPNANNATFMRAMGNKGNLEIFGTLMTLGLGTAVTGLWARDILFGKTPRDMTKPENMAEALSRSVMPLWGEYVIDAFSGDFERRSVYETIAGPGFTPVTNTVKLLSTISNDLQSPTRTGVSSKKQALKMLQEVIPGTYMPVVRPILDQTLYKSLGRMVDPNFDRKQQKSLDRRGQSSFFD